MSDDDLIRRGDVLAKVTAHSEGARAKMAAFWEDQDGDSYDAWGSITSHLDIVTDTMRAIPAADPLADPRVRALVAELEHLVSCARVIIGPGHRSWHKAAGAALKGGAAISDATRRWDGMPEDGDITVGKTKGGAA